MIKTAKEALLSTSSSNFDAIDKTEQAGSNFCSAETLSTCKKRSISTKTFTCSKCNRVFKYETSYIKHCEQCRTGVKKKPASVKTGMKCWHCNQVFKSKWRLNRHTNSCTKLSSKLNDSAVSNSSNPFEFAFNDSFFSNVNSWDTDKSLISENLDANLWFSTVLSKKINAKFSILHLNVNSIGGLIQILLIFYITAVSF